VAVDAVIEALQVVSLESAFYSSFPHILPVTPTLSVPQTATSSTVLPVVVTAAVTGPIGVGP